MHQYVRVVLILLSMLGHWDSLGKISRQRIQKAGSITRAPREPKTDALVLPDCSCPSIDAQFCLLAKTIRDCCTMILDTTCGTIIHIRQSDIPLIINQPGRYCILEDLTTSGTAITITASGVSLDFNNHTILLTDALATGLAMVDTSNAVLYDGYITSMIGAGNYGMFFENAGGIGVNNLIIDGPTYGIKTRNGSGILIEQSGFTNNVVGIQIGEQIPPSPENPDIVASINSECIISNCILTDFTAQGILLQQISNTYVQDVILRGTGTQAQHIAVDGAVHSSIIRARTEGLGAHGILIQSTQDFVVSDCFIYMQQNDAIGIALQAGIEVIFDGEEASIVVNQVRNMFVADCIVSGTFNHGMHVEGCDKVVIEQSQVFGDGAVGIFLKHVFDGHVEFTDVSLKFATSGISIINSEAVAVEDVLINIESPVTQANAIDMLNTLHATIERTLITISVLEGDAIGGDGIVLLGGVRGCVIQDCLIDDYPEIGILTIDSPDFGPCYQITIDGCIIHNALQDGIQLNGTYGSSIQNCDIAFADFSGIDLRGCNTITILNNIIQNNGQEGLVLDVDTINCAVRDNTVIGNLTKGIDNAGGLSQAIYHNFAQANGAGPVDNYTGVALVVTPGPGVGVLENISQ